MQDIEQYIFNLCKDIKKAYLDAHSKLSSSSDWPNECQKTLKRFVAARKDWTMSNRAADILLYKNKFPLQINILYAGSPSGLLITTAQNIAIVEILSKNDFNSPTGKEYLIQTVGELVKKQDWILPFSNRKTQKREKATFPSYLKTLFVFTLITSTLYYVFSDLTKSGWQNSIIMKLAMLSAIPLWMFLVMVGLSVIQPRKYSNVFSDKQSIESKSELWVENLKSTWYGWLFIILAVLTAIGSIFLFILPSS